MAGANPWEASGGKAMQLELKEVPVKGSSGLSAWVAQLIFLMPANKLAIPINWCGAHLRAGAWPCSWS